MQVDVTVLLDPRETARPPLGTPVHVELRDTSLADAPSVTLAAGDGVVDALDGPLATISLTVDDLAIPRGADLTVGVRVGSGDRLQAGDWITMESVQAQLASDGTVVSVVAPVRRVS